MALNVGRGGVSVGNGEASILEIGNVSARFAEFLEANPIGTGIRQGFPGTQTSHAHDPLTPPQSHHAPHSHTQAAAPDRSEAGRPQDTQGDERVLESVGRSGCRGV